MKKNLLRLAVVGGMLITLNQSGNAQNWSLTGNAGTTPGTNFLGTTDTKHLYFKTKNATRMAITSGGKVGIGITSPSAKFQIEGTANTFNVFSFSNDNNTTKDSIMVMASNGNVGIGTASPANRLNVVGDVNSSSQVVRSVVSYVGLADVRAVEGYSHPADGWGYGVYGEGGWIGCYGFGNGGASGSFGLYGYATGTAGTHYGVYGYASGGADNWGGYFPTKTYTSEIRVGTSIGATGYIACIGGKLIAEEVRVLLTGSWPDYVFDDNYKLMSIEDLEQSINTYNHLPGLPSSCEVEENGLLLGDMQSKVVEKVEESHLYIIQLQKQINKLNSQLELMSKEIDELKK